MKNLALAAVAALSLLVPTVRAQLPVTLSGTVERLATPGCDPTATHGIRCADVLLASTVVDLNAFVGRTVTLTGSLRPNLGCPTIDVDSAVDATARTFHLALLGTRLGRSVNFTTIAPPGSIVAHIFGCSRGFLPLGPLGSILIGVEDAVFVGTGISVGVDLRTERIPNDPNLVGVTIYYQFAYASLVTGFEAGFLNPGCFVIAQ